MDDENHINGNCITNCLCLQNKVKEQSSKINELKAKLQRSIENSAINTLEEKLAIATEALEIYADSENDYHVKKKEMVRGSMVYTMKSIIEKTKLARDALNKLKN